MNLRLVRRIGLCCVSGAVVGMIQGDALPLEPLGEWSPYLVSGLTFAAGVLAPYIRRDRWVALRALGLVAASSVSYLAAVSLAGYNDLIEFTMASVAGAALVIVPVVYLAPVRASRKLFLLGLVSGLVGGPVTRFTLQGALPLLLIGHVLWHTLIGLALYFGTVPGAWPRASSPMGMPR